MSELRILLPPEGDENVAQARSLLEKTPISAEKHFFQLKSDVEPPSFVDDGGRIFSFENAGKSTAILAIGDASILELEKHHYNGFVVATACSSHVQLEHKFTYYINPSCVIKLLYDFVASEKIDAFFCVVPCKTKNSTWVQRCIDCVTDYNIKQSAIQCSVVVPEELAQVSRRVLLYIPGYDGNSITDIIAKICAIIPNGNFCVVLDPMYSMFSNEDKTDIGKRLGAGRLLYVDVPKAMGESKGRKTNVILDFVEEALLLTDDIISKGSSFDIVRDMRMRTTRFGDVFFSESGETFHASCLIEATSCSCLRNEVSTKTSESQLAFLLQRIDTIFSAKTLSGVFQGVLDLFKIHFCNGEIAFHENETTDVNLLPNRHHFFLSTDEGLFQYGEKAGLLLSKMSRQDVIQFGGGAIDLPDNGVFRIYQITGEGSTVHCNYVIQTRRAIVLARDINSAAILWKRASKGSNKQGNQESFTDVGGVVIQCGLLNEWKHLPQEKNDSYVYFFPAVTHNAATVKPKECSYAIVKIPGKLSYFEVQVLSTLVSRVFVRLHDIVYRRRIEEAAAKSAIGSIMSRNGSHNIGSHVLSSLSHNVGTMPEDRKLYQYIQHRMDYIATATTEFPAWRQPTMLVSDMIRTFLSQTHLLNYISRSEGLHAYQFQNPSMDQTSQHQTIMLNVRRVKDVEGPEWGKETLVVTSGETEDFINYTEAKQTASFERDLAVAIPGGVVGQHAFFTILENTIRNAAKHEWAKALKTEKEEGNLEVYVDFHDNPEKGVVEMLVWNDRVGVAKTDMEETVRHLREKFKRSFISPDSGELVRENWGLAEMRISAGYLKNAGIDVIGGIGEKRGAGLDLVRPVVVQNGEKQCLGFRFDLQKPKELLVVVPDSVDADDLTSINKILARFGIEMMPLKEVCAKSDLAYSYVLINDFDFDQDERLWPKLPFRVLAPIGAWKRKNATRRIAHYDGSFYCVAGTTMAEAIKHLKEEFCNPQHVRTFAHELLEDVYASWLHHVRSMQNRAAASMLVVDVDGGEEGRAKSLVTDSDLLHFVFEHSFNSAVRGYLKTVGTDRISPQLAGALYSLAMLQSRTIMTVKDFSAVSSGDDLLDNRHRIATQLIKLAEQAMSSLPSKIDVSKPDQEGNRYVHDRWEEKLRNLATRECLYYLFMGCGKILKGGSGHADVRAFVEYLHDVVLEQARSFLAKYEERVVTLPRSFGVMKREGDSKDDALADKPVDWKRKKHEKVVLSAFFSSNRDKASAEGYLDGGLCYWRHGDDDSGTSKEADESKKETIAKPKTSRLENALYFEPLSGSQSYLNSLIALQQDLPHLQDETSDKRLAVMRELTGLVENALMHILIIDERATKFAQEHPEVARVFKDMGIYVCDDTNPAISGLIKAKPSFSRLGDGLEMTAKDFEIVIVHQGIIDKLLKDHTQANVGQILDSLMQHLRYLVVTTGRGTPFNIPPTARVLPFSVVESTLFKRYPEKMLLVDTVMHLLPGERK